MKPRPVDLLLLVALVVVSGAIVWTLFSLGRSGDPAPSGNGDDPPTVELPSDAEDGNGGGGGVVPIAPGEDPADDDPDLVAGDGDGDDPDADGNDPAADGDANDGNAADDGADDEPAEGADDDAGEDGDGDEGDGPIPSADAMPSAEEAGPPPEGAVDLRRIGFSYVTGGAGACGITLEAWEHVAVSRELLEAYGCGAEVTVTLADETGGNTTFQAVVADTMNPAFSRTVNVYVGEDEPALSYGLTSGSLDLSE